MNSQWLVELALAAQGEGGKAGDPEAGSPGIFSMLPALLMIMVMFYFVMVRPERRKQAAHRALLEGLKKNDRVVTVGGIYGVVAGVQREANEVTLKVDEANNTKIRVTFASIAQVITDAPDGEKPS